MTQANHEELQVRSLTIVDDQGRPRIELRCATDGMAEIVVRHPFREDTIAVLSAGMDTEDDNTIGGANVWLTDGNRSVNLDELDGLERSELIGS